MGKCPKCKNGERKTAADIFGRMGTLKVTGVIDMERNKVVEVR